MLIIERILCWLMGIALVVLAFRSVHKDKWGFAASSLIMGVFLFCSGMGWVQGLAKTWLVSNVNSKLTALGKQIDDVQTTTAKMQDELSQHQTAIDKHQKELDAQQGKILGAQSDIVTQQATITNQFGQLNTMQTALASTQTNIDNQQRQIPELLT